MTERFLSFFFHPFQVNAYYNRPAGLSIETQDSRSVTGSNGESVAKFAVPGAGRLEVQIQQVIPARTRTNAS